MASADCGAAASTDLDLPLLANVDAFRVRHYIIRLELGDDDLQHQNAMRGDVMLFVSPTNAEQLSEDRLKSRKRARKEHDRLILDCRDLCVQKVEAVTGYDDGHLDSFLHSFAERRDHCRVARWHALPRIPLTFETRPWSLDIQLGTTDAETTSSPFVIRIAYEVRPCGMSLYWRRDYAGNPCVFTSASPINNRALFPCQEPPVAMATWQAVITAPTGCTVLCTGDRNGFVLPTEVPTRRKSHYFYTSMVLPMSTFAMAVGRQWKCVELVSEDAARMRRPAVCPEVVESKCNHVPYPCHVARGDVGPSYPVASSRRKSYFPRRSSMSPHGPPTLPLV